MTIQEIFDYCNTSLLESELTDLSDIISFLNEAQNVIARLDMIQAAPVEIELTTNEFSLPADFLRLYKATLDDKPYAFDEKPWAGVQPLPEGLDEGTVKLWYYKKPATLLASTPTQVPEIDPIYHPLLGDYAAKMYYLIDDDPAMRDSFAREFQNKIAAFKTPPATSTRFVNY